MASKITAENILDFNRRYYTCHNYSQVARETGFSASTIRKYVDKNWTPAVEVNRKIFNPQDLPENFNISIFKDKENFGELCILSDEEISEIKDLWNELEV